MPNGMNGLETYQQILKIVPNQKAIIASGGAVLRSPTWLQIIADVLNEPVAALAESELTSRGIALLAVVGKRSLAGSVLGSFVGTFQGIAVAMAFVSVPFLVNAARAGFEAEGQRRYSAFL